MTVTKPCGLTSVIYPHILVLVDRTRVELTITTIGDTTWEGDEDKLENKEENLSCRFTGIKYAPELQNIFSGLSPR